MDRQREGERKGWEREGMDKWKEGRWERDRQMKEGVGEWERWRGGGTDRHREGKRGQCEINNEVGMSES